MKKRRTPTQVLADIRKSAEEGTLEIAPQTKVTDHVFEFLNEILGVRAALVTDESSMRDFMPFNEAECAGFEERAIAKTKKVYGVDITPIFDQPLVEIVVFVRAGGAN